MESCIHFLGQVNSGDFIMWKPEESFFPVSREDSDSRETVLEKLRQDMLSQFSRVTPDTTLVLFFENGFSLHNFCQGFVQKKALSYPEVLALVDAAARDERLAGHTVRWFYPYPDLAHATHLFSEERLPQPGECEDNLDNFGYAAIESFDERAAVSRIVSAGLYGQMAGAYMVVFLPKGATAYPDYCKFSVQRREDRQIMTLLYPDRVEKCALCLQAADHVLAMRGWEKRLSALLDGVTVLGRPLRENRILAVDEEHCALHFEYVRGDSLETLLDDMLPCGKDGEVEDALLSFVADIRKAADRPFVTSAMFQKLFGAAGADGVLKDCMCLAVTDIDLVCQNIIVDDKEAVLIDYEWVFDFPIPVDFVIYRFLYFYLEAKNRCPFSGERTAQIYQKAGLSPALCDVCARMETQFQNYVQEHAYVLRNDYEEKGGPVLRERAIRRLLDRLESRIVIARGGEKTVFLPGRAAEENHALMHYRTKLSADWEQMTLTLKGFGGQAFLRLGMLLSADGGQQGIAFETNGQSMGGQVYFFAQEPVIMLHLPGREAELLLSVEEIDCSKEALGELKGRMEELDFLYHNREEQLAMMQQTVSWKVTAPLRKIKK